MADPNSTTQADSKSSESPFPGPPPENPSRNHFVFVLIPGQFDLNIPAGKHWCRKPFKYLRFLAWAILHLDGKIALKDGTEVDENGWQELTPHEIYYFVPNEPLENAKPINVRLLAKTELCYTPSEEKQRFRRDLKERDESCPFSSMGGDHNLKATHIMPLCKGDEWLQMLIESRYPDFVTGEGERLDDLSLEDIKNGFLLYSQVRHRLEAHDIAILPTPNHIIKCEDLLCDPERLMRYKSGTRIPKKPLYALHWFREPVNRDPFDPGEPGLFCHNALAAFNTYTPGRRHPKPSCFLLECMYAATVVHVWGRGTENLEKHPGFLKAPIVEDDEEWIEEVGWKMNNGDKEDDGFSIRNRVEGM